MPPINETRRKFLRFLAASPLLAGSLPFSVLGRDQVPGTAEGGLPASLFSMIETADDALDVFDFARVAQHTLPPAHWGYLATGTDGNETLTANRRAFEKVYTRPLRMTDTSSIDTSLDLLGESLSSPIVVAPAGSQRAFHPEGELAVARAAAALDHLQILSNVSTSSIEDVIAARGAPVWFQLYPTSDFDVARPMIERAERAGAPVLVLTVDLNADSKRVALSRYINQDDRDCSSCHDPDRSDAWLDRKPMYDNLPATTEKFATPGMTWEYIDRLRSVADMKIVVKGIVTAEDATAAVQAGVDAVYVSNHGGRAEASGWGALESLPEVSRAVAGEVPVMVDSGFRRGNDIFKALALGADAVCIGRAYLWGLAAFGQPGVEKVLEMLRAELDMVMAQMGTASLSDVTSERVGWH